MATERLDILVKLNDGSKAGTRAVKKNLTGIGLAANQASTSIKTLGASLVGITALFTAGRGFSTALRIFTDFDDALRQVGAVTNATNEEFIALTETAKELGATTRFTATQAAEGLKFLGLAGFEAAEAIKALPNVLDLAAAGSLDLGQAADITTNILAAFGFEVEQLGFVNDVLVKTFTSSNNNLIELGEAFKLVGPIAKGVGANFEDLLAAIGKLGDAGLKASIGGTSLRGTLAALFNPTKEEAKLMEELSERIGGTGLQIKDANGNFIGFVSIIKQLEQAALTGDEALKLFGLRAGPGVAALLNQGSAALEKLQDDLLDAGGTAQKIAKEMEAGIGGATRQLIAALESLRIGFINAFGDTIIQAINGVTEALREQNEVLKQAGPLIEGLGNIANFIFKKAGDAVNNLVKRVISLNKVIALFGFAFTTNVQNEKVNAKIIKDEINEILYLLGKERPAIIPEVAEPDLSSFDNFKSKLQNYKVQIPVSIVPDVASAEAILKSGLIKFKAFLDQEVELTENKFKQGTINIEQFFNERKSILQRQYAIELKLLNEKLLKEEDASKKELLNATIIAKQTDLQTELIKLDQERYDEQEKLRKKNQAKIKKDTDERLRIEKLTLQANKSIDDLKVQNSLVTSNKLKDIQKNELLELENRQKQELEKFKILSKDKLQIAEFEKQQRLQIEKLLSDQKKKIVEEDLQSEQLLNDLKFQNAVINSTKLQDIFKNERAELERQQTQDLKNFKLVEDDKAKLTAYRIQQELQLEKLLSDQKKRLKAQELQNAQEVFTGLSQLTNDLYQLTGSNNKELFALSKAAAIAEATINTYTAATKALSQGGPFAGPALATLITLQGLANVARIQSQSLAEGGEVKGYSPHSKADNIPANLTAGEYVNKVSAVKDFGLPFMNLINSGASNDAIIAALSKRGKIGNFSIPKSSSSRLSFSGGGPVPRVQQNDSKFGEKQAINIINITDPSEIGNYLNTNSGKDAIINAISSRAQTVRRVLG